MPRHPFMKCRGKGTNLRALLTNDQSTPAQTSIYATVTTGKSVTLFWGDGDSVDLTADGAEHLYQHTYSSGTYTIKVSGDLGNITSFKANSQDFLSGDIGGFSALTSLQYLYLYSTSVSGDIGDLSALTSLQYLYLYSTSVTGDIGDLSGLTSLQNLYLYSTSVSGDIGDLSALTSLQYLRLNNTSVTGDVGDLSELTSLLYLYLYSTSVSGDIGDLSGLTSLEELYLNNTSVSGDIGDLSGLTSLEDLRLNNASCSYGSVALPAWAGIYINISSVGLDSTEVDNFLIDLADGVGAGGTLNIAGSNAARTGASDAAKAALLTASWNVTVNE